MLPHFGLILEEMIRNTGCRGTHVGITGKSCGQRHENGLNCVRVCHNDHVRTRGPKGARLCVANLPSECCRELLDHSAVDGSTAKSALTCEFCCKGPKRRNVPTEGKAEGRAVLYELGKCNELRQLIALSQQT